MKQGTVLTLFGTILLLFSSSSLMAVTEVSPGFFQGFVWFITSPVVSGILVAVGLSCILLEFLALPVSWSFFSILPAISCWTASPGWD